VGYKLLRHGASLISLIFLLIACQQAPVEPLEPEVIRQARRANSFVDSIGINTHIGYNDTEYNDFRDVQAKLGYLGIRHIRDAIIFQDFKQYVVDRYRILGNYGVRVTGVVPYKTNAMSALIQIITSQRDVLEAVEGPNETDLAQFGFSYKNQTFPLGTIAFMKDFYPAIKNDPQLRSLPVIQTALAHPYFRKNGVLHADLLGDLSRYADYGNNHNYFAFGQTPSDGILGQHLSYTKQITPGKQAMATEGGYRMDNWDGYKDTWEDGQSACRNLIFHKV
jgi:hypothetical protein